ncbi:MAG: sigma-70 family RNA polymerase sigma factor [Hymenobacteraceae bacterium]|nr:sigma-70 family RNA polymerase sigma factor [Hymenobacteraceae bacterium]
MSTSVPDSLAEADLLAGCARGDLRCQKLLYKRYYGLAMHLCQRYAATREEAAELLNDGFMKVFTNLATRTGGSFEGWLRRVMVNTAIDHFRRAQQHKPLLDLLYAENRADTDTADAIAQLSAAEILAFVQQLSPACRLVFNLYVVDGYSHAEIGQQLGISEGASKSNLHKARHKLQRLIERSSRTPGYTVRTGTD